MIGAAGQTRPLVGIGLEVVEFEHGRAVGALQIEEADQLVTRRRDAFVARDGVRAVGLLEAVVSGLAERLVGRAAGAQQRQHRLALQIGGDRGSRCFKKCRREVEVLHQFGRDAACGRDPGPAHEEGHAKALLVHPAFVEPAVLAEEPTLVAGVDDQSVVGDGEAVELGKKRANRVVDALGGAQIVLGVTLKLPRGESARVHRADRGGKSVIFRRVTRVHRLAGSQRKAGKLGGHPLIERVGLDPGHGGRGGIDEMQLAGRDLEVVVPGKVARNLHLLHRAGHAATGVVVEQRRRLGDLDAVEQLVVARLRHPVSVRRLVVNQQRERLPALLGPRRQRVEPLDGLVVNDVGHMTFALGLHAIDDEGRIPVVTLANEHIPMIEPGWIALKMPLADDLGAVARGLQKLGESLLRAIELVLIGDESVDVTVLAGQHHRARRAADGVGHA